MNAFDRLELDAQLLRVLLTVIEEGSVTRAAARLGVTQSAVSHAVQRLNRIVGETLFVKSGRGIVATTHATALAPRAAAILQAMQEFSRRGTFEPARTSFELTIAANDLQRDLLLPALYQRMARAAAGVRLRIIPSELPSVELLRRDGCDLLITPIPPEGSDVVQRRLFTDSYVCYFDAAAGRAPRTLDDYLAARHATVVYPDNARLRFDKDLERIGVRRDIAITAPSFAAVSAFLRGSDLVASMPSLLAAHLMRGLGACPIPLEPRLRARVPPLTMYLVWHRRRHQEPAHAFVREHLIAIGRAAGPSRTATGTTMR